MALVSRTKIHYLTSKELRNFKVLVLFVFLVYGLALPLWFALYGHSFLHVNERWVDIVGSKTHSSQNVNTTKHIERRRIKDVQNSKLNDENIEKNYNDRAATIPRPPTKFSAIYFKKTYNSETGIPRPKLHRIPSQNGRLLSMKWDTVCCQSVNSLRKYPLFPRLPSETRYLRHLRVPISGKLYGERIIGRLAPPETGTYSFLVKCSATCELWLGQNEYPRSSKLLVKIAHGKQINVTAGGQQKPFHVALSSGRRYFIDILFTVYRQLDDPLEVFWKIPSVAGGYRLITQEFFSGFVKTPRSLRTTLDVLSRTPSTRLTPFLEAIEEEGEDDDDFRTIGEERDSSDTFYDQQGVTIPIDTNLQSIVSAPFTKVPKFHTLIFPYLKRCDHRLASNLAMNRSLAKYEGVWRTSLSSVYPNDNTGLMMCIGNRYPADCQGNDRISNKTVQKLLSLYTSVLNKQNLRHDVKKGNQLQPALKVTSLVNIEQKIDSLNGSRFLLEVGLNDLRSNSTILQSQYLYMDKDGTSLCSPGGFTVDLRATINVVVVAEGQPRWLRHFLANMERVYLNTNDEHLNIIIAKYGRDDTQLMEDNARNLLPRIRMVRSFGVFDKAKAIQSAVDTIQDQSSIVFLVDLHILIPETMMSLVRKHTVREKMVFNPVLFRLAHCGSQATATKPSRGFWETFGYGILGIYKSDWDRIGGMSSNNYSHGWGGEDWELLDQILLAGLEVDRLRVPNFYHFYHSKKGMWN